MVRVVSEESEIHCTESAREALLRALKDSEDSLLLAVSGEFSPDLSIVSPQERPKSAVSVDIGGGLLLWVEGETATRAHGASIDFVPTLGGEAFRIFLPQAPPRVSDIDVLELKMRRERGEELTVVDVRTEEEMRIAPFPGAVKITERSSEAIVEAGASSPVVFVCHHGVRSRAAAEHFLRAGCLRPHNLVGGIDAWSLHIDDSVPRY